MNTNKRSFEREPMNIQPPILTPLETHELACEDNAVRVGIMTDRTYKMVPNPLVEPSDNDHVWLFIPARTSKRSIQNLADTCGSKLVRFFVRVRCLAKYVFSDKDFAFHLNADGRYYMLTLGTISELQVHVVTPEQNPAVLEFVRAHRLVPPVPAAAPDA